MSKKAEARKQPAAQTEEVLGYFVPQTVAAKAERLRKLSPLDDMYAYYS